MSAIMKNGKASTQSKAFNYRPPPKFGFLFFLSLDGSRKLVSAMIKNGSSSQKMNHKAKLSNPEPHSLGPSVNGNQKLVSVIMSNWKNGSSSLKMCPRENLSITNPLPMYWSSVF